MLRRILKPSNFRVRLAVGVLLAAVLFIQCAHPADANRGSSALVTEISGQTVGHTAPERLAELEKLAKTDHIALLKKALTNYDLNYQSFTGTFIKHERIGGQMRAEQWVEAKFMEKPFSVALHWVKNPPTGDRILYVDGKYNGNMLVNPANPLLFKLAGTVMRPPDGPEAMANTLKPVTQFGLKRMMENLLVVYEQAAQRKEGQIKFAGYQEIGGVKVMALERELPARNDYPAKKTVWYFDPDHMVVLGVSGYDWDDQLICTYIYKDLKYNVPLTEADFTPEANQMKVK